VTLDIAAASEAPLLENLLELYIHDLSPAFPRIALGPDGRFGYPDLARYWSEPGTRFPFVIRRDGAVAGFVLATRGSPAADDPDVFDVAEFFVLRAHRGSHIGRDAAFELFDRLAGRWSVRVSEGNTGAVPFWRSILAEYTHGIAVETARAGTPHAWRVFSFTTRELRALGGALQAPAGDRAE
jgi:predicted acetyltransferase